MTRTKFKKIPFDLELAKKITNKEVKGRIVTRDGRQVRIICFDKIGVQGACQIVALFRVHPDEETVFTFSNEGVYRFGNKTCYDLFLEVPTSNFEPQKYQPCLVRDTSSDLWRVTVCCGKDAYDIPIFYTANNSNGYCHWVNFLPLSNVTERLVGTTKSYEQLIQELDAESGNGNE